MTKTIYLFTLIFLISCNQYSSETIQLYKYERSYWACYQNGKYHEYEFDKGTINAHPPSSGHDFKLDFKENKFTVIDLGKTIEIIAENDTFYFTKYVNNMNKLDTGVCLRIYPKEFWFWDKEYKELRKKQNIEAMLNLLKIKENYIK